MIVTSLSLNKHSSTTVRNVSRRNISVIFCFSYLLSFRTLGVVILFGFALFATSEGVKLECSYGNIEWKIVGEVYRCYAKEIQVDNERLVTEISGNHMEGKRNSDVKGVYIRDDKSLTFIPRNLGIHFPNIIALQVSNCSIHEVSQTDLTYLPNLKAIWLYKNNIKIIPYNLFVANPALELISLHDNPINNVGYGVFDLKTLKELGFYRTTCINEEYSKFRAHDVSNMTRKIYENCTHSYRIIKELQDKVESQENAIEIFKKENRVKIMSQQNVNGELRNLIIQVEWKIEKLEDELRRPKKCKCET